MAAWAGVEKLVLEISDPIDEQEAVARWPIGSQIANATFTKREKDKRIRGTSEWVITWVSEWVRESVSK